VSVRLSVPSIDSSSDVQLGVSGRYRSLSAAAGARVQSGQRLAVIRGTRVDADVFLMWLFCALPCV